MEELLLEWFPLLRLSLGLFHPSVSFPSLNIQDQSLLKTPLPAGPLSMFSTPLTLTTSYPCAVGLVSPTKLQPGKQGLPRKTHKRTGSIEFKFYQ
ncbi:hypothetical protein LEMLEM_LOCUS23631 [Lemmus lemmus]